MLTSKRHFFATNSYSDINKHCALYHHPDGFSAGKRAVYVMRLQFPISQYPAASIPTLSSSDFRSGCALLLRQLCSFLLSQHITWKINFCSSGHGCSRGRKYGRQRTVPPVLEIPIELEITPWRGSALVARDLITHSRRTQPLAYAWNAVHSLLQNACNYCKVRKMVQGAGSMGRRRQCPCNIKAAKEGTLGARSL